jgi:hypothetical protein
MEMRESIHYALASGRWFEMDAKNCDSVENLWSDFRIILLKLNFVRANLTLEDGRCEWKRSDTLDPFASLAWSRHQFLPGETFSLELAVDRDTLNPTLFHILSEIAAESWQRSAASWCRRHSLPLRFESRAYPCAASKVSQSGRAYVPLASDEFPGLAFSRADDSVCQMNLF